MRRSLAVVASLAVAVGLLTGTSPAQSTPDQGQSLSIGPRAPMGDVVPPDPSKRGPYATERIDVVRSWNDVNIGYPAGVVSEGVPLVEDISEVTYPVDSSGEVVPGQHPVVVLLHGMHEWCSGEGPQVKRMPWWCRDAETPRPVPNYQGYRYIADVLASQGRVVVSISANGLNSVDFYGAFFGLSELGMRARSKLVAHHLRELAAANEGPVKILGKRFIGHLDLERTMLVGHSRGGEGVVVAAQDLERMRRAPATVVGVVNLAPTAFAQSAPANTPTMTLLPACDGDVVDLQGQSYVERGRDLYGDRGHLRSSVWFAGGNHNFLNTEWTPGLSVSGTGSDDAARAYGDDADSGSCRPAERLSPGRERTVGLAYVAAFARWTQDGDGTMLPLLDGTGVVPLTLQRDNLMSRVASLAGPDRLLAVPGPRSRVSGRDMSVRLCRGSQLPAEAPRYRSYCGYERVRPGFDTSWLGSSGSSIPLPGRTAVHMTWSSPGLGWLTLERPRDLTASSRLSMRVVIDPQTRGTVRMLVRDADGASTTVALRGQSVVPLTRGAAANRLVSQTAWIETSDLRGIDLTRITGIGLATTGSGGAWILDISHRTAKAAPSATILPISQIDWGQARVPGGTSVVNVRVRFDRPAPAGTRLAVSVELDTDLDLKAPNGVVRVPRGVRYFDIPLRVTIPRVVAPNQQFTSRIIAYPIHGITTGSSEGFVSIVPKGVEIRTIDVVDPMVEAEPGEAFTWDFTSSDGQDVVITLDVAEAFMDYSDLDAQFREDRGLPDSGPIASGDGLTLYTEFVGAGLFRATLPLSPDAQRGTWITYAIQSVSGALVPKNAPLLTGTVGKDAAIGRGRVLLSR